MDRGTIEHHLRECRMNMEGKHLLPRERLMELCETALLYSIKLEECDRLRYAFRIFIYKVKAYRNPSHEDRHYFNSEQNLQAAISDASAALAKVKE